MNAQDAQELIEKLETTPAMRQLREMEQAETLEQRTATAAALEKTETDGKKTLATLSKATEKAAAALHSHDEARKPLAVAFDGANLALRQARGRMEADRQRLRSELYSTADPAIDEGIQFFRDRHDETVKASIHSGTRLGGADLVHETRDTVSFSNHPAILEAAAYCRDCIELLEGMKLEPGFNSEAVEHLKQSIPSTETLTEYDGEKVLEGKRPPSPFAGLISDDEIAYRLRKADADYEQIKRRQARKGKRT